MIPYDSANKFVQLLLLGGKACIGFAAYFGAGLFLKMNEPVQYSAKIKAKIRSLSSFAGIGRKM
jgi:hypothetical protein